MQKCIGLEFFFASAPENMNRKYIFQDSCVARCRNEGMLTALALIR